MTKFKKTFVPDIQAKLDFEKEQEELKQKHNLETDKIVVEKSNMVKFTVNTVKDIIRTVANILLFILAAIGIVALVYPEPRQALIGVWQEVYMQLKTYFLFLT